MQINVEVGELRVGVSDGRVSLIVHDVAGDPPQMRNVELSLSPLAAHNLGVVLPDYAREAADEEIAAAVATMREPE